MAGSREFNFAIGFDGGDGKTECVIVDAAGKVCARASAGLADPLQAGFDAAFKELAAAGSAGAGNRAAEGTAD